VRQMILEICASARNRTVQAFPRSEVGGILADRQGKIVLACRKQSTHAMAISPCGMFFIVLIAEQCVSIPL